MRTGRHRAIPAERESSWYGYAPLDANIRQQMHAAFADLGEGLRRYRSWIYLAVESVKNEYRRTVLGPWWLTLQTLTYVLGVGALFSVILEANLKEFLPYVAIGFIGFSLLSGMTRTGATIFISSASMIRSTQQPLSSLVLRVMMIEFIHFCHTLLIYTGFVAFGLLPLHAAALLSLPFLAVILVNGVALGLWLGITVARFRDVGPLVMSILQILIFFTPVFWRVDTLHPNSRVALTLWNPFAYLLDGFRAPLLGEAMLPSTLTGVGIVTAVNVLLGLFVFVRARSRLPYWVA